jgi:hypothetical protein
VEQERRRLTNHKEVLGMRTTTGGRRADHRSPNSIVLGADAHHALYPVRLSVVESNGVTHTHVTGCGVLCRTRVGQRDR